MRRPRRRLRRRINKMPSKLRLSNGTYIDSAALAEETRTAQSATITTTGAVSVEVIAPFAGRLTAVQVSGTDALAANDTNYLTFTITNLGQAGAGNVAMLAVANANTTKATGGTALGANARRNLTVHGTAANVTVAKGDRLRITATPTGTLANTVTNPIYMLTFSRTS